MKRFPHGKANTIIISLFTLLLLAFDAWLLYTAEHRLISFILYTIMLLAMFGIYALRSRSLMRDVFEDLKKTHVHFPKEGRGTQRLLIWFLLFLFPFALGFILVSDEYRSRSTAGWITGYLLGELYHIYITRSFERKHKTKLYYDLRGRDRVIFRRDEECMRRPVPTDESDELGSR